jgi:SAM-dependent methyltransferase
LANASSFDVVSLFDVLEHLPDPTDGLDIAAKLLKPSGLLIFSTGDADAWTWRYLGSDHWYLQTAQHLGVLSRTYIERLARNRNWHIRKLDTIPHTRGSLSKRLHESIQLLHWSAKGRDGLWRVGRRLLQEIPGCRDMRHRQSVPWTMTLKDHMFVGIRI